MKIRIPDEPGTARLADGRVLYFGVYRVPEDLSDDVAQHLLDGGEATLVEEEKPVPPKPVGKK